MNRLIVATCSFAMLVTLVGCKSDNDRRDSDRPRMSQRELMNRSKLEPYPDTVEAAFIRDYPTANVTDVNVYNDATGRAVYEVNYVRDGRAGDVVYTAEGVQVEAPANRVTAPETTPPARTAPPPPPPRSNR